METRAILVFLAACYVTNGARIIGVFPYQGRSHNIMFEPLMIGLARAGHTIDMISHFPPAEPVPGYNHINLKGSLPTYVNNVTASHARKVTTVGYGIGRLCGLISKQLCSLFETPQVQNILNTDVKYDLMVTEVFSTNCFLAVAYKLKIPVVGVGSSVMYAWGYDPFYGEANPSFIPSQFGAFTNEMSFIQRVENTIVHFYSKYLFYSYDKTVSEPVARKHVPDLPSLNEIYNNMSLLLVNSHYSVHGARPGNPAIVEVAGLHIDQTQALSKELDVFLNSSKDGVIYFSMGTMVRSDTFDPEKISAIYESFSELSNYKVLWKGNVEDLPKPLPSNVKVVAWAPQYAVLRHPKVKAFVTHGGLMGTIEAIQAGVPMVGMPFMVDQTFNIMGYVHKGIAVHVNYEDLTKARFSNALREVLLNPKYQSNSERIARLFKDRPLSPLDEAIFWIEYVIRNGGEPLKSSGRHLNWFQYYLLDVFLFLINIAAIVLAIVYVIVKKTLSAIVGTKSHATSSKKKIS
ncbi:UDP-glucosyltransferase 2-like isoform X2 [Neodiprion pinetum]|uniref:UDP-glucosyltransferase 2-like isoform X2 n=1 Tax=Neodiprion pinetum TaxID=441929 RepID=UPI001EDF623A|nr:UDP-glucosyltransferase 2-like isoform X2 [Neodiprion pinetum]XP_046482545.1 UDP-glucosyltransferase 2-like isoform X2 [Neodiprion pinetum]